jgi:hypothetical protein
MVMDEQLIEALSERVHRGWELEKQRQGFADHVFRPLTPRGIKSEVCYAIGCTLPAEQHHADMLPYAELAEHVKEYDRATVRAVLGALTDLGYWIAKEVTAQTPPPPSTASTSGRTEARQR